ncbi:MAG: hypothetical protein ACP5OA_05280, partial [Candidatus Woesearchaeota archaeon]
MKKTSMNSMSNMNKSGQITVFIILGIIILFSVALVIYWQNSFNKVRPPVQQLVVDDALRPVQSYVTDCLNAVSKDALIRLGQNGGYITLPNGLRVNPGKPYDSDALFFEPQVMPYWYYMRPCEESSIGCSYPTNPPVCKSGVDCVLPYKGQNSMEEQLNNYIEENIGACINDFAPFKELYDITSGELKIDSQITELTVNFKMDYPLDVQILGSEFSGEIPYFYVEHDLKLKKIYQFAQEIRDAEANYTFLERHTLNLISVYSGIDSDLLPPMSGMEMFVKSKSYWIRTEVKEALMDELLPYTMLLQFANAGNAQYIVPRSNNSKYIPFEEGFYRGMIVKVSENLYPELDANVYYPPGTEIYLNIGGSEVIKPKSIDAGDNIIMKIVGFAFNDYSFKYDLTYPVIVSIRDTEAFNGQGYTFNYAMQANIRQNVPISQNMTVPSISSIPTIDMEDTNLRINRQITIEAYDKYTKEPLEDVLITYKCGYEIFIGATRMNNGKAILTDKFPFCEFGGVIVYEREGYMSSAIDYDNKEGTDAQNFRIELWPLKEKKFVVYKRTESDVNSIRNVGAGGIIYYSTAYTELTPNDTVYVNMYRSKDDPRESDVPMVGFVSVKADNAPVKIITKQSQIDYVNKIYADGFIDDATRDEMLNQLSYLSDEPEIIAAQPEEYVMDF